MLLQYKLKVSRSQGKEAQQSAEEASSSYKTASEQLSETQEAAAEAASTAAAEINDLQVFKASLPKVHASCNHVFDINSRQASGFQHVARLEGVISGQTLQKHDLLLQWP